MIQKIQTQGRITDTLNTMNSIQAGINNYYLDQRAYPGPLSNDQLEGYTTYSIVNAAGGTITSGVTGSENLVLGLMGGLTYTVVGSTTTVTYTQANVGRGPFDLLTQTFKNPFLELQSKQISDKTTNAPFKDENGNAGTDSAIPEFLDGFSPRLPILYMRARKGAAQNVVKAVTSPKPQYDMRDVQGYINGGLGTPKVSPHTQWTTPNTNLVNGTLGIVKGKDAYFLISAGPDGEWGTGDDLTTAP